MATKDLKFVFRNDGLETTKFDAFVKIKIGTNQFVSPAGMQLDPNTNFFAITTYNKVVSVTVPDTLSDFKVKVKVKDKVNNPSGEKDESNTIRFSVSVDPDPDYIYCLSIDMINDGTKIRSASESEDFDGSGNPKFFGGKGNTIVIGAGMP